MINKGMEIAIKERLTADRLTGEINQRCKYRYSKYCRDGKEANMLLYYITILKVLFMAKGARTTHAIVHLKSHSYRWNVAFYSSSNHKIH
jgi:hypothetical protein